MAYPNFYYPQTQNPYAVQPPVQQAGFIRVPSEEVARNWNVMPGTSATFINENAPYCYTKTVGFSQLDGSKFKKYRLVEENDTSPQAREAAVANEESEVYQNTQESRYALKTELNALQGRLEALERIASKLGGIKDESTGE